jgi:hypothetical protein
VVTVPTGRLEWLQRDDRDRMQWLPLLREFQRLHPGVQLQLSVVPEADLEATLQRDRSRGLGPDLLVLPFRVDGLYWRISSFDRTGLLGRPSDPRSFVPPPGVGP